jgi:hypothetical protein
MIRHFALVFILVSTGTTAAPAQTPTQSVRIVWQIGEADRPNYDLGSISDVAVDQQGNIYVGQSQETSVRVFDANGRFLRRIGRYGNGPGELQSVSRVFVRGNQLHVHDISAQRLVVYSLNGTFREHWTTPRFPAYPGTIGGPRQKFANGAFEVTPLSADSVLPVIVMKPDTAQKRVLATLRVYDDGMLRIPGRITMTLRSPVEWGSLYRSDPRGNSITFLHRSIPQRRDNEAFFTVVRMTPDGDTLFTKRFRYEPRYLSDDEWEKLVLGTMDGATTMIRRARSEAARRSSRAFDITDDEIRAGVRAKFPAPMPYPPIDDMRIADDGSTWLRQTTTATDGMRTWLVLDRDGVIGSRVRVPDAWTVAAILQNHVYAIAKGLDDIPIVVKARIMSLQ